MTMKPCLHRTRVCRSRWWWRCDGIRDAYGVKYHRYMAIIGLVNLPDYSGASPPLRAFLFASTPCQQLRQASWFCHASCPVRGFLSASTIFCICVTVSTRNARTVGRHAVPGGRPAPGFRPPLPAMCVLIECWANR